MPTDQLQDLPEPLDGNARQTSGFPLLSNSSSCSVVSKVPES